MKYPYIGRLVSPVDMVALFISKNTATPLTNNFNDIEVGEWDPDWHELSYKNITHEYLSNTWGVVESKEHAEFIVELAELHGFNIVGGDRLAIKYFCTNKDSLVFCAIKSNARRDRKQITIPLPPKAKEWPQVGDEVCWDKNTYKGTVKAISGGNAWCVRDNGYFHTIKLDKIEKPKSKQELLIEELQTKLCNNNAVDNYILACDIINGEIEGLSYEV